jgi:hypothetical protein
MSREGYQGEGKGQTERVEEDENGGFILYLHVKIEQLNLLKLF